MPELCAERREPPTARICQPGRERVSAIWATMAMTTAVMTLIEMPRTLPSPMKSQTSEVTSDSCTCGGEIDDQDVVDGAADDKRHQRRQEGPQPHVADEIAVDGAAQARRWRARQQGQAHTGRSRMKRPETAAKAASAKIELTERSMPPASMTTVRPVTTIENSPSWRVDSTSELGLKNPGMAVPKPTTVITSARNGMALSAQRLVRISPIR